jgi:hypothetical protein
MLGLDARHGSRQVVSLESSFAYNLRPINPHDVHDSLDPNSEMRAAWADGAQQNGTSHRWLNVGPTLTPIRVAYPRHDISTHPILSCACASSCSPQLAGPPVACILLGSWARASGTMELWRECESDGSAWLGVGDARLMRGNRRVRPSWILDSNICCWSEAHCTRPITSLSGSFSAEAELTPT